MTLSTLNWRRREMVRWLVTCATEVGECLAVPARSGLQPVGAGWARTSWVIHSPGHLSSPESPISSWVTGCTLGVPVGKAGATVVAGFGTGTGPLYPLSRPEVFAVPCSTARQGSLCLSPPTLSPLEQRQWLSTAVGWLQAPGGLEEPRDQSRAPGLCHDPSVSLQE